MTTYKYTQVSYVMLAVTLVVLVLFVWVYSTASAESVSIDSGPNFAITAIMACILFLLASFVTLTVSLDENSLWIRFGSGIFRKKFAVDDIVSAVCVKNHWYHGWGIRVWFWPYMWICSISGFDAVEITLRNGKIYRIGTDTPSELEVAIKHALHIS
ncbi:MAG: hypothetical protein WBO66_00875 [Candidatus Moraniibacteriota bacterium]